MRLQTGVSQHGTSCWCQSQAAEGYTAAKRITWHDRPLWEVTVEELVIDCDVLVANSILAILNLDDTVNQQEGVPASRVPKDICTLEGAPSWFNSPTGL